jgi:hypothetical protein
MYYSTLPPFVKSPRGGSKIEGLRYEPPHQTNKGSRHAQDPHSKGHLPPRRAVHPPTPTPQNHPMIKPPLPRSPHPPPTSAPAPPPPTHPTSLLSPTAVRTGSPTLAAPPPARLGHLALSPPDPSRSALARAAHWAGGARDCPGTTCQAVGEAVGAGGGHGLGVRYTLLCSVPSGGGETADALAWERGRMGLLAVGCGWWGRRWGKRRRTRHIGWRCGWVGTGLRWWVRVRGGWGIRCRVVQRGCWRVWRLWDGCWWCGWHRVCISRFGRNRGGVR